MRKSIVKQKLRERKPTIGVALHFIDPSVYEMTSLAGFDFIWMDLEHHAYSVETANNLMRAARVGTSDIMARPAKREFMRLGPSAGGRSARHSLSALRQRRRGARSRAVEQVRAAGDARLRRRQSGYALLLNGHGRICQHGKR
jgi:hypothetical protein